MMKKEEARDREEKKKESRVEQDEAVYVISIAARLANVHPQTLRIYERKGLLKPSRVRDRRRYSQADIERCKIIQELTQEMGVNLAGVKMILDLQDRLQAMSERALRMEREMESLRQRMVAEMEALKQSMRNDLVPLPRGDILLAKGANPFSRSKGSSLRMDGEKNR